nr:MAG: hypothetical protein DIU78_06130 [Pseudomonadota bacterium]
MIGVLASFRGPRPRRRRPSPRGHYGRRSHRLLTPYFAVGSSERSAPAMSEANRIGELEGRRAIEEDSGGPAGGR